MSDEEIMNRARLALIKVYNKHGPRQARRGLRVVPVAKFAAMTNSEVDRWDFDDRHLMQTVAKAIVLLTPSA